MSFRTYILLTLRYLNPRFKKHLRPYDWRKAEYWKLGFRVGFPLPAIWMLSVLVSLIIILSLRKYIPLDEATESYQLMAKFFVLVPSLLLSYFATKKCMPPVGEANQYDRKTIEVQFVIIIIITLEMLLKSLINIL
mgnify:CR=1 FL=1